MTISENEKTQEVIKEIYDLMPSIAQNCEVVGEWVWAEFETKPTQEVIDFLKSKGFHWNRKRKLWQNACGIRSFSTDEDPKTHYIVAALQ